MPELDYSVYFYTYSTIAQTLAGAFGFLVAVILYMLQGINAHISNCATTLVANSPADRNRLRRLHSSGRWDEMIRLHVESGERNPELTLEMNKNMAEQFYEMQHESVRLSRVRKDLSVAMYMTGVVILAAIVGMPLTAFFLAATSIAAMLLLTITCTAAMFCIRAYLKLMEDIFRA
jgi:hypothetical protein